MRCSIILAFLAIVENVAYGFSQRQSPPSWSRVKAATTAASPVRMPSSSVLWTPRGGGSKLKASPPSKEPESAITGIMSALTSLWGTTGVLYILAKAIKRVLPIAMEPFQGTAPALSQFELGAYIVTCLWFAYVEGYKGFQQKFSPLVVKRSFTLQPGTNGVSWFHVLVAPLYSMGLVHATKKRKIVSWSVTMGVAAIVAVVKRFPYPWRNIVDAGVVVGLTWGSLSIVASYMKSIVTGSPPSEVSAELPESSSS